MLRLNQVLGHLDPPPSSSRRIHHHDLNPVYFLHRSEQIEPNALAVVHGTRRFTYAEHAARVRSLAYYFKAHNLKRIAIVAPNTPAHLETMYAGTASGGIIMGLNYRLSKREIEYMLDLGEADCVVVDYEMQALVDEKPGRRVIVDYDFTNDEQCAYAAAIRQGDDQGWEGLHSENVEEDSLLGFFFTSGTTGMPKAVEYTHRGTYLAALANAIESNLNTQTVNGEGRCRYLWTLPMFHASGWTYPYAVTAVRGTHYCLRRVDPDQIWQLLKNEHITHYNAAPTVNTMLVNSAKAEKLAQQVRVVVAASPPSAKLFEDMMSLNLFPVHMYGLTETYGPFAISYYNPEWNSLPKEERFANMARQGFGFLTSAQMRVVDSDMNNVREDGKQIGEIVVRGNIVARGYYRNPEETKKAFGEYFKTGDLAVVHADKSVQILDRKKDIIISGGENISSVIVEGELMKHPAVLEVAVVGVPHKLYGEMPVACIILKQGKSLNVDELIAWAKQRLGGFQVPRKVVVVTDLPKTATGKVKKNLLREQMKL